MIGIKINEQKKAKYQQAGEQKALYQIFKIRHAKQRELFFLRVAGWYDTSYNYVYILNTVINFFDGQGYYGQAKDPRLLLYDD